LPPGAAPPVFSENGTHGASDVTATFSRAGRYVLAVTITDRQGLSVKSSVALEVFPILSRLAASPQGRPVHTGETIQLSALGLDQFGVPLDAQSAQGLRVNWFANDGSVDAGGAFTAPTSTGWYSVTAIATLAGQIGTPSLINTAVDVYVYNESNGPTLLAAWSRKTHGRRGMFDLPLMLYGGRDTIEPRRDGPTTLRFKFNVPVVPEDGRLDETEFSILNATFRAARISGSFLTLDLAGARDRQPVLVVLQGLTDTAGRALAGDQDVWVWSIYGDVTGDGAINTKDMLAVRQRLLRPVGATDFLRDLDLDGSVTTADLLLVRRRAGITLS
jgi:hypothetical protein